MALLARLKSNRIAMALWARLAAHWRAALAVGIILLGAGSFAGFKAYHFVEHDNRLCLGCHLMDDPWQRFASSAHARIECHDCHKSTRLEQMAQMYETVFHNPTKVTNHARVPNAVCVACHESGDSLRWRQVANTAGHRMHMRSSNPKLKDLQCVACHGSTELHAFATVQTTCAKAGCHADQRLRLGRMSDLQIYCATCHEFMARSTAVVMDSVGRALSPQAAQCLSCHPMQARLAHLEIGTDPHKGQCGLCHDPHRQTSARAAVKSCTSGSCHLGVDTVGFHRGVAHPEQCTTCHQAHSFRVEGDNCTRCHANIPHEQPSRRTAEAADFEKTATKHIDPPAPPQRPGAHRAFPGIPAFSHGDHRSERCASCHDSRQRHGQLRFTTVEGCRSCHHVGQQREQCAACHRSVRTAAPRAMPFALTVNNRQLTRPIRFAHTSHTTVACARCHDDTAERAPSKLQCASCHDSHHSATATCSSCHQGSDAIEANHKLADHATCATSSCHGARGAGLPNNRAMCLTCHEAQQNHRPGKVCNDCHRVRAA